MISIIAQLNHPKRLQIYKTVVSNKYSRTPSPAVSEGRTKYDSTAYHCNFLFANSSITSLVRAWFSRVKVDTHCICYILDALIIESCWHQSTLIPIVVPRCIHGERRRLQEKRKFHQLLGYCICSSQSMTPSISYLWSIIMLLLKNLSAILEIVRHYLGKG